jgi:hypothetical protein
VSGSNRRAFAELGPAPARLFLRAADPEVGYGRGDLGADGLARDFLSRLQSRYVYSNGVDPLGGSLV